MQSAGVTATGHDGSAMTDAAKTAAEPTRLHGYRSMLVGTLATPTGTERILAGRLDTGRNDAEQLHLVIEVDRPSNAQIIEAYELFVHTGHRTRRWTPVELRLLTDDERRELQRDAPAPLGDDLALMVLRRAPIPPTGCLEP